MSISVHILWNDGQCNCDRPTKAGDRIYGISAPGQSNSSPRCAECIKPTFRRLEEFARKPFLTEAGRIEASHARRAYLRAMWKDVVRESTNISRPLYLKRFARAETLTEAEVLALDEARAMLDELTLMGLPRRLPDDRLQYALSACFYEGAWLVDERHASTRGSDAMVFATEVEAIAYIERAYFTAYVWPFERGVPLPDAPGPDVGIMKCPDSFDAPSPVAPGPRA